MLIMLIMHTTDIVGWKPFRYQLMSFCYTFIEPIIFLSGFLICRRMMKSAAPSTEGSLSLIQGYAFRRIVRTWPMYFGFVLICFAIPSLPEFPVTQPLWKFLTFTMNYQLLPGGLAHLWTLCLEEWCYLVFAFSIPFLGQTKVRWVFLGLALLPFFLRIEILAENGALPYKDYFTRIHYFTLTHWDSFWWGCLLATFPKLPQREDTRVWCLVASFAVFTLTTAISFRVRADHPALLQATYPVLGALGSALLVCGLPVVPARHLIRTGLVHFGIMSYTFYLTHKVILAAFVRMNRQWEWLPAQSYTELLGGYLFLLITGAGLFWVFERPLLNYLRRPIS